MTCTFIRHTLFSHQPLFKVSLQGGSLTQVLLYALVTVFDRHSILFNQLHAVVGIGAIILDAADKLLCVQVIIFGLNNIAINILVGSQTILRSTCASW